MLGRLLLKKIRYKVIKMSQNRQEVFDKVARHLLTQKERATIYDPAQGMDVCRYRADNGMRCAIGCLIPDDYYQIRMEGMTVSSLFTEFPQLLALFDYTVEPSFLQALQNVHDNNSPNLWKQALTDFATIYKLNADVLKEFE
jgi:hypothetical protein